MLSMGIIFYLDEISFYSPYIPKDNKKMIVLIKYFNRGNTLIVQV